MLNFISKDIVTPLRDTENELKLHTEENGKQTQKKTQLLLQWLTHLNMHQHPLRIQSKPKQQKIKK